MTDLDPDSTRSDLAAALVRHANAIGTAPPEAMLSEWVIVTHWTSMTEQDRSGYCLYFSSETLPHHHVLGLLSHAENMLLYDDEDD